MKNETSNRERTIARTKFAVTGKKRAIEREGKSGWVVLSVSAPKIYNPNVRTVVTRHGTFSR